MPKYASSTSVSTDRSKAEIESILRRFGASSFAYGWKDGSAIIEFAVENRRIRFTMKLPTKDEKRFTTRLRYGKEALNDDHTIDVLRIAAL